MKRFRSGDKMTKNETKYNVAKAKGKKQKYTEL